jgi:Protein of unknown function (DUF3631)
MAKKPNQYPTEGEVRHLRAFYFLLGSSNRHERDNAFARIWATLRRYGRAWSNLLDLIAVSSPVAGVSLTDRFTLREQHELLGGAAEERETAREAILWILQRYRASWNDLLGIIAGVATGSSHPDPLILLPVPTAPDPLELLTGFLPSFFDVTDDEYIAIALWILHSFFFSQFKISPRLVLTSPVPGCGKSTILDCIELLGATPLKTDGITPAAICDLIDRERRTPLIDEADNLDWQRDGYLRRVVNSGHSANGKITKLVQGEWRTFSTFSPLALATLERLPLALIRRSIVIRMAMTTAKLSRVERHHADFNIVRMDIIDWSQGRELERDPEIPSALNNRVGDNWRILVAIADACGPKWGTIVRDAAVRLSSRYSDADLKLILLADIKTIFDRDQIDRITAADLVAALIALDGQPWWEWRGVHDTEAQRRLTTATLKSLLGGRFGTGFGIWPRTVWPPGPRAPQTKSADGFYRQQFEDAWRRYLPDDPTDTQSGNFIGLAAE